LDEGHRRRKRRRRRRRTAEIRAERIGLVQPFRVTTEYSIAAAAEHELPVADDVQSRAEPLADPVEKAKQRIVHEDFGRVELADEPGARFKCVN